MESCLIDNFQMGVVFTARNQMYPFGYMHLKQPVLINFNLHMVDNWAECVRRMIIHFIVF